MSGLLKVLSGAIIALSVLIGTAAVFLAAGWCP
jgi:hypothetical protein